ncbi:MAG: 50S ribosomal protein L25 [Armatimonadetes bacterium]|nr:MAG: 50S ribosomal protein L25 [Armatimonadota bacterium]
MQQETLIATKRSTQGTRASKRLRRDGRVPGIVYGKTVASPHAVHVAERDLYGVLRTDAGLNAIIEVDIDGEKVLTVAREIQRDPVRGDITHLDFIQVSLDVEIEAEVHIEYLGIPFGVLEEEGIAETIESSITISALPNAIPTSIEVDISHLHLHDTLTTADLPKIDGVEYTVSDDHPLLTVVVPAAEIVEEVVLEGEEGEEGVEAIEGEEGEEGAEAVSSDDEG